MRSGMFSRSPAPAPARDGEAIGFDVTARGDFTLPVPILVTPQRMTIYRPPINLAFAEVAWLAVVGDPASTFVNNVTWIVTVTRAGPQEHLMQSLVEGATSTIDMAGMRWGIMGSLTEPFPVKIRVSQGEVLGLAIVSHTAAGNAPLTIYTRAAGQVFR